MAPLMYARFIKIESKKPKNITTNNRFYGIYKKKLYLELQSSTFVKKLKARHCQLSSFISLRAYLHPTGGHRPPLTTRMLGL